ncbi:hypothetical protein D9758_017493 [Tetrapyrgos nigripes]|uniref:Uncharacterized protein n=1 Tax=Tetrapyrgos nigripes TaxID=182062 RepID=A0A8H5C0P6_9AGAR|nr:hypothetical protein D9758_017493 [Tetrapyrgos nigripes]
MLALSTVMPFFSVLYPILVILMVSLEKSKDDSWNSAKDLSLSESIRFASAPAEAASQTQTRSHSDLEAKLESQIEVVYEVEIA